jgi:glycosyltransferase involved in cell wall biosynthesis
MQLALVHDWLNQVGGAEDVLMELVALYPDSPIYTSIYWREGMPSTWQQWPIHTLWMDKLPAIHRHHQPYLPLYPLAFSGLDLSQYELVLSNKSGFCHGFKKGKNSVHVCYCLAPTRYVWQYDLYVQRERLGGMIQSALLPLIKVLQRWDYAAAQRVDHFIAISTDIQDRIKRFYDRDSVVIFPPVDVKKRFLISETIEDYYLVVSRLIPYKRIELVVEACTRLNLPLLVGGKGRDLEALKAIAGPTVKFLGYVPDEELPALMARCRAFLFPGFEDFGITPVQAQAAGRPVIAYRGGGALDTVIAGVTGEFFDELTVESLMNALRQFNASRYSPAAIRDHALKFDRSVFQREITAFVNNAYEQKHGKKP